MARRRRKPRKHRPRRPPPPARPTPSFLLLDRFSLGDLQRWTKLRDTILRCHWEYYCSLAYQRSLVAPALKASLLDAAEPFRFERWQRVVKYKYALEPLSPAGSLADVGGRFNIGDIDPARFPPFPALYLSSDRSTALQEALGQDHDSAAGLTALDLALTKPTSIASVSVSGSIDSVIDLNNPEKLQGFVDLIRRFVTPGHLSQMMRDAGWSPPGLITTVPQLMDCLLDPNWRQWPNFYDVPVSSQIFGQIAAEAGIEGIRFPSKFSGKDSLAVFPQRLANESHVVLDDDCPAEVRLRRLDSKSWKEWGHIL